MRCTRAGLLLCLLVALTAGSAAAQVRERAAGAPAAEAAPRAAWVVSPVFANKWHMATAVAEVADGSGYLIAGQRDYNAPGQVAAWVMKVDRRGRTRWWRNFDAAREVRAYGLAALPDGGAFVAGAIGDDRRARPWIARISPKAWVFWEKTLPPRSAPTAGPASGPVWSGIERLATTEDGVLLAAGTDYLPDGSTRTWLLELDAEGTPLRRNTLDLPGPRGLGALVELPDGTLALGGPLLAEADTPVAAQTVRHGWVARATRDGEVLWDRPLDGGPQEAVLALAPSGRDGVLAGGWQIDNPWFGPQGWTRRFDAAGAAVGELNFGDRAHELVAGVLPDGAGGHWLVGLTEPNPQTAGADGPTVAWKRTLDAEGWLGEQQFLGASARLALEAVARTSEGGLLIVGWRTIRAGMRPDIWIARFVLPTG